MFFEYVYRTIVGNLWHSFHVATNAFVDAWVGEGCFFVAALTSIIVVCYCSRSAALYVYKGPISTVTMGIFAGLISGFLLEVIQVRFLEHAHSYAHYALASKQQFPATKEAMYCLAVAVTEETAFRAYLFPTIERTWGTGIALSATSAIFALGHLSNLGAFTNFNATLSILVVTFSGGFLFAACLVLTGRVWMSIALHFSLNFFHSLSYGDASVGVFPIGNIYFDPSKVNQLSFVLQSICGLAILALAIRRGNWRNKPI